MKPYSLQQRCELFNTAYSHLPEQRLFHVLDSNHQPFVVGAWFVGGGNVSAFYGSYQTEYLKRVDVIFPDCKGETMHLFSGSLPPSKDYIRVGMDPTGQYKSDLEVDIHDLAAYRHRLPRLKLIFADPPYSAEDSQHYQNSMVNRPVIMDQCAQVLDPGGYIVWMDQALPVFSNKLLRHCGTISYIRSTGNRFRCVVLFQRRLQ